MKWKEGGQFENPTPGNHIARCIHLIDMGTQTHNYGGNTWQSRDVRITFELPYEKMEGKYNADHKGKPFAVSKTMKQSLHPSSNLRPFLEAWRGRKFTKEELAKYEPRKIVGVPCRVTLVEDGDRVFLDSISPISKNDTCPAATNPLVYFSLEPEEFDPEVFNKLTEKTREKIKGSPEYVNAVNPLAPEAADQPDDSGKVPDDEVPF